MTRFRTAKLLADNSALLRHHLPSELQELPIFAEYWAGRRRFRFGVPWGRPADGFCAVHIDQDDGRAHEQQLLLSAHLSIITYLTDGGAPTVLLPLLRCSAS